MRFETLFKTEGKKLVTFVTAGHPCLKTSRKALDVLVENGADILEIGFPFSDPMADGPVIEAASGKALENGTTLEDIFKVVEDFRSRNQATPIILMGYYNPVFKMGVDAFLKRANKSGVYGLILVDLPLEEETELTSSPYYDGLSLIHLITPMTNSDRVKEIVKSSSGFLYYVSVTGVTGVKQGNKDQIASHIENIRKETDLPIMVGFGIRNAENAQEMGAICDGVVVGSSLVSILDQDGDEQEILTKLGNFVKTLRSALNN